MSLVRQIRVLRNVACMGVLWGLVLWLVRMRLWENRDALGLGIVAGGVYGLLRWWHLSRHIARRDRRYERNKIFVDYLHSAEVAVAAIAYNYYLAIPLGVGLLAALLVGGISAHWWTVLVGSFGLTGTVVLAGYVMQYEHAHGPLHYQYASNTWSGAEGMLYQQGIVVEPLTPAGKVKMPGGVFWNAVSMSGEPIDVGEEIEVISLKRLTLYVDRCTPL